METHKEEGRAFHRVGSMVADGLVWTKFVLFSTERVAGSKSVEVRDRLLQKKESKCDPCIF